MSFINCIIFSFIVLTCLRFIMFSLTGRCSIVSNERDDRQDPYFVPPLKRMSSKWQH